MGQRSTTETLAGIYQAFLAKRTWRQPELARELGIGVEALRRVLFELMENGMPLERDEEDRSRVFWSVPSDWFPESVLFKREEVPELLRQLRRAPQGPGRKRLLDLVLARLPRAKIADEAVVPAATRPEEEQFLDVVEQSASERVALAMKYFTAGRGDVGDRHVSVHRVLLGPPARLVATCHRSGTLKTFRVDSIVAARLDGHEPFRDADDAAVAAYQKASVDGFHGEGAAQLLSFLVRNPDARWVKNNLLPGMKADPANDGVRVSVHTAALRRVAQFVVGLGASATSESAALSREVAVLARGALEAAESVRAPGGTGARAARVTLRIDGKRAGRRVGVLVNGARLQLREQLFLYLLRLVIAQSRERLAWRSLADLGFPGKVALPSRLRAELEPLVPEGFEVVEKKEAEYRLSPEIVVEHVDWRALQGDEDPALARAARDGARTAQPKAKEEEAGRDA